MKIEIEDYRGQTICYNDDNDKFECEISIEDHFKSTKRQSLTDVRKEIDNFIKLNLNFVPFKIIKIRYGDDIVVKEVTAIRSDGKFVIKDQYGNSYSPLSELQKDNIYDPSIIQEFNILQKERNTANTIFNEGRKELIKRLKPLDLSKYTYITNSEE